MDERDSIDFTCGNWPTEIASATAFDSLIESTELFKIYREVRGTYILSNPFAPIPETPRIDRILSPKLKLLGLGWKQGAIGVELKASGIKVGPPLAQLVDYRNALWRLDEHDWCVYPKWLFLWPLQKAHGTLASLMAQLRFGSAGPGYHGGINFYIGEQLLLRVDHNGQIELGKVNSGTKNGSR